MSVAVLQQVRSWDIADTSSCRPHQRKRQEHATQPCEVAHVEVLPKQSRPRIPSTLTAQTKLPRGSIDWNTLPPTLSPVASRPAFEGVGKPLGGHSGVGSCFPLLRPERTVATSAALEPQLADGELDMAILVEPIGLRDVRLSAVARHCGSNKPIRKAQHLDHNLFTRLL